MSRTDLRQMLVYANGEQLPEPLVFRVRLNQSYDGHAPRPGELRFPEHSHAGDTEVTDTALSGIRAERPGIRMFPRPPVQNNDA
ncbi:hypothetical protein [Actinomadura geliboluensis]|uniref:hypothetical protein n=1 Tax=Actinomadura geliboluensis TaxID=882440 RepID=UPI00261FF6A8|nr:hypothetical protein [Actinomadura geliboluensis]